MIGSKSIKFQLINKHLENVNHAKRTVCMNIWILAIIFAQFYFLNKSRQVFAENVDTRLTLELVVNLIEPIIIELNTVRKRLLLASDRNESEKGWKYMNNNTKWRK